MRVSIILPFPVTKPVGGPKIMYEYANRLALRGHAVTIYHSIERPFKQSSTPTWLKQLLFAIRGVARPKWFPLSPSVESKIVPSITDKYIVDADVVFSTWWQMAYAIHLLSSSKGKKFNLIQDYEVWKGDEDKLLESYRLPIQHMVIARYLQQIVFNASQRLPIMLPNAIDDTKFFITLPPQQRKAASVIMLYSKEPRKGSELGLTALKNVKNSIAELEVNLFGVYEKPANLPVWITYHQKPSNLATLYNNAAVFFSPSLGEGWALPPAEAMACGCAVVCTNIGGHADYAINQQTALLCNPEDIADMEEKIKMMILNNELRQAISLKGTELIAKKFNWDNSVDLLENCISEKASQPL